MKERQRSLEQALEEAVSRALRDNLAPLQRTADELHQAYADLVAACSSSRPSNALPAMLRAQTAASALAAGLSVLSNFVAVALNPRESRGSDDQAGASASAVAEMEAGSSLPRNRSLDARKALRAGSPIGMKSRSRKPLETGPRNVAEIPIQAAIEEPIVSEPEARCRSSGLLEAPAFDVASLPASCAICIAARTG